jgi:hydrogenase expression/formation protein HypC
MCLGVPGRVIERAGETGGLPEAVVEFGGVRRRVCIACVPDAEPGEFLLVHAGVALQRVDPAEARRVFDWLRAAGESDGFDHSPPGPDADAPTEGTP